MCGIAGILDLTGRCDGVELRALAEAQNATLVHRGPDAGEVWTDPEAGVTFAHRRLSIIDLSPAGAQPMASSCGRFVIVYNGEAYNTEELRAELLAAGRTFRGHSDTEVIVEGCAVWGVRGALDRLNGMFAFAVWDRNDRVLFLARDRLGIKPLYWARTPRTFLFGSELKALLALPDCPRSIDRGAVVAFLRHAYVPAPGTIFDGVRKLPPGCLLTVPWRGEPREDAFWDLDAVATEARADPFAGTEGEGVAALDGMLRDAVKRQMVSDVPLGVFLSGGIDSSTVTALMQAQADRPVRSFSIGFAEAGYDESKHAAAVARYLGTDHTELTVTPAEARDLIPTLPDVYDEPFADSSQIPTLLLSRLTREHVTVALSGDGGDELFAGYSRHVAAQTFGDWMARTPRPMRSATAAAVKALPRGAWDTLFKLVPASRRPVHPGERIHKFADVLPEDAGGYYRRLITHWWKAADMVPQADDPLGLAWDADTKRRFTRSLDWMQYVDTLTYLPDDILTKVDRASMAVSLETRVPLLDHRVVAFSWRLPADMKVRDGQGKWLLRQVLDRYVPKTLIDRPKMGFGVPVDDWLRGPLRDWAENLLSESSLRKTGLVDPIPVRQAWAEHLSGRRNRQHELWSVLMLQAWHGRWAGKLVGAAVPAMAVHPGG